MAGIADFLTQRIGPVPMWAIVGVGGVGLAIFAPKLLAKLNIGGSSDASTSTPPAGAGYAGGASGGNTYDTYNYFYGPPPGQGGSPRGKPNPRTTPPVRESAAHPGVRGDLGPQSEPRSSGPRGRLSPPGRREPPGPPGPPQPVPPNPGREPPQEVPPGITPTRREPPGREPPTGSGREPPGREPPGGGGSGGREPPDREPPAGRGRGGGPIPPQRPPTYVHPMAWPANDSTLEGLAAVHGISEGRLRDLNGWIYEQRGSWNAVYPGDNIRIS